MAPKAPIQRDGAAPRGQDVRPREGGSRRARGSARGRAESDLQTAGGAGRVAFEGEMRTRRGGARATHAKRRGPPPDGAAPLVEPRREEEARSESGPFGRGARAGRADHRDGAVEAGPPVLDAQAEPRRRAADAAGAEPQLRREQDEAAAKLAGEIAAAGQGDDEIARRRRQPQRRILDLEPPVGQAERRVGGRPSKASSAPNSACRPRTGRSPARRARRSRPRRGR